MELKQAVNTRVKCKSDLKKIVLQTNCANYSFVEEQPACFVVKDHGRQKLARPYFEDEPGGDRQKR